jgi:hypothetical protein
MSGPQKAGGLTVLAACLFLGYIAKCIAAQSDSAVIVTYPSGPADVAPVASGMKYFTNRVFILRNPPEELNGLMMVRRPAGQKPYDITIDAPAGATVYLILGSDTTANGAEGLADLQASLMNDDWTRLPEEALYGPVQRNWLLAIYKKTFSDNTRVKVRTAGWPGVTVAAAKISAKTLVSTQPASDLSQAIIFGGSGPAVHVATTQASAQILEVAEEDGAPPVAALGRISLAASPGEHGTPSYFLFDEPTGAGAHSGLDISLRSLGDAYTGFDVGEVHFSFTGGATGHDDPGMALATAVLIHSMIQGFQIDPELAIVGNIAADGKVSAVTAFADRLGAAGANCRLVIAPEANFDQLVDAKIYFGLPAVLNAQVLGVATIDDAVSCARQDRDDSLTQAIRLCAEICDRVRQSPGYLQTDDAGAQLHKVVELAPNDLTARLLLQQAQGKLRRRLSIAASECYAFTAAGNFLPDFFNDTPGAATQPTTRTSDQDELRLLRKVRPMADLKVQPLIDAWSEFIQWQIAYNSGRASTSSYMFRRQALMQEMTDLKLDRDAANALVRQGN